VLTTTRAESAEPLAQTLQIPLMKEREGVLFLLRRSGYLTLDALLEKAGPEQYEGAHQIWQMLDGLPLALDQAGAYIRETKCSFTSLMVSRGITPSTATPKPYVIVSHHTAFQCMVICD